MANPVAIDVDFQGRVFVCESYRQERGVEDNRNHPEWLLEDLAAQTVADRVAYMRKHLGQRWIEATWQDDQIRLLTDIDQDGHADQSRVFANRFNAMEEGTGAGVLSYRGDVFYTCIPRLWQLRDEDRDGICDTRHALHSGFGVRFAFRGHDLHGLILGPDGRLYFSIGDRGYHIKEGLADPESGAVFRCELDGTGLEVIATGLRNPQELAFDNYGNLFTGDNNSDSGDRARMVFVVPGSDSGWRMAYQYLPDRGPFNREKIWHPYDPDSTPAYIVPPIDNFADGPSGFAFYPGSGFSDHMRDRFLLCDFRGQTSGSGVKTFRLRPAGAFWSIADEENSFWNLLATDCCFGPDGRLYVSDWVHGWDGIGKGRIYAFTDANRNVELTRQVQELLASDWSLSPTARLLSLLGHADRRVRQEAQFELARRGPSVELSVIALSVIALSENSNELARIHALWALDQIARSAQASPMSLRTVQTTLWQLMRDAGGEPRNQAIRLAGELSRRLAIEEPMRTAFIQRLTDLVRDPQARCRYFSAIALGQWDAAVAADGVLEMLAENQDQDPILRHGGIMALVYHARHDDRTWLAEAAHHDSASVRLAAVVALRKLLERGHADSQLMAGLLQDANGKVQLEAARAVHDLPVLELLPELAALQGATQGPDQLTRRVLNANFRIGDADCLRRVRDLVFDSRVSVDRRRDAIQMLVEWRDPPVLDKVLGIWRPVSVPDRAPGSLAVIEEVMENIGELESTVRQQLLSAVDARQFPSLVPGLIRWFRQTADPDERCQTLQALSTSEGPAVTALAREAAGDEHSQVRIVALNYLVDRDPPDTAALIEHALRSNLVAERQNAITLLARSNQAEMVEILRRMLRELKTVPPDSQLDVVLAADSSSDVDLKRMAQTYLLPADPADDPLSQSALLLWGGDAQRGADIFFNRADVYCLRCHKIAGSGGDVGPDLSDVGSKRDRMYLLESLLQPSKTITEGFETIVVLDGEGKIHVGVTKPSSDEVVSLMTAEAILLNIPAAEVEEIRRGDSAMPDDITKHLTLADLRDLIEYLATRK